MNRPSQRALAGHHIMQAIKHLTAAAEFVRELPDRDSGMTGYLELVVEGCIETVRDVSREIEKATR